MTRWILRLVVILGLAALLPAGGAHAVDTVNPHGELKEECSLCHSPEAWKPALMRKEFDHSKYGFKLENAHAGIDCRSCHATLEFKQASTECASCHADVHQGEHGSDCQTCHSTRTFQERNEMVRRHALSLFPLTGAHETVDCGECHQSSAPGQLQFAGINSECEACHAADYAATRNPDHQAGHYPTDCAACHDTRLWETASFDHELTAFPLRGAHADAECAACHGAGGQRPSTACASCHRDDFDRTTEPPHVAAGFSDACADCHGVDNWEGASFDHATTDFPLEGAHAGATCDACHGDGVYTGKSTTCVTCHQTDFDGTTEPNHPSSGFPTDCTSCHNSIAWRPSIFDHALTRFPLTHAHALIPCNECHGDGIFAGKSTECVACHQSDYDGATDPDHRTAGFPTDCSSCHTDAAWSPSIFDHALTAFPLTGAHQLILCNACHGDGVFDGKPTACITCHQSDYDGTTAPHHGPAGFSTDCTSCHATTSWDGASFDHDATQFPLTGAHVDQACASCHADDVYDGKSTACASCHQTDYDATAQPPHAAAHISTDCASCHTTSAWEGGTFDHNATRFALSGAHSGQACASCHGDGVYVGKSMECVSCHQADYDGASEPDHRTAGFPNDCTTCHTTSAWQPSLFDHALTAFPLTGAHQLLLCNACHGDGIFDGKPTACISCHQADYDGTTEPHHGPARFSTDCTSCHTNDSWQGATFDHLTTDFPLTGAHVGTSCTTCHADAVYGGKSSACVSCHQDDFDRTTDPDHRAAHFPDNCAECHGTTSFEGAGFDHDQTDFPLRDAHVGPRCMVCHTDGVFSGRSTACVSCHQADYNGTTAPNHQAEGFPNDCAACHNMVAWDPSIFDHALTLFPLTGAHQLIPCRDCHGDGVWHGKDADCASCHQADYDATDNPHHGAAHFALTCGDCHGTTNWDGATFDHSTTSFPLQGKHTEAACNDCHADAVYDGKSTACYACHQTDWQGTTEPNHQQAGFPTDCTLCHGTDQWDPSTFDHALTLFPLTGAHQLIPCSACHGGGIFDGTPTDCWSCHSGDFSATTNPHHVQAQFSHDCTTCHGTTSWEGGTYDHALTDFPLTGKHDEAECSDCHGDAVYNGKSTQCYSCHQTDWQGTTEPNHQQANFPTDCSLCHGTSVWEPSTFNHANTQFPLTGAHQQATCNDCHADGVYDGKPTACWSCHSSEFNSSTNPHHPQAQFSHDCTGCHGTSSWNGGTYNHALTSFPLTGKHIEAECSDCHGDAVYNGKSTQCYSCHQTDWQGTTAPNHQSAGFPTDCSLCHSTSLWDPSTFNHALTLFPLTGAHRLIPCEACHGDGIWDGKPTDCWSCHSGDFNGTTNPHHGPAHFSHDCTTCHTNTSWDGASYNHNQTAFPLTGAHQAALCSDCHADALYDGKSTLCFSCHESEWQGTTAPDHQAANFPTDCSLCHSTSVWDPSTFNHANTQFPLTGAHVDAECNDCHGDGVYDGKPTDCWSCHASDFNGTTDPNHQTLHFPHACESCHSTDHWDGATFDHDGPYFPIYTGAHRNRWSSCATCHTNPNDYHDFTCLSCHPHDNRQETDNHHNEEPGYQYESHACYNCHPRGRGD